MNLTAALCQAVRATTLGLLVVASIQGTSTHAAPAQAPTFNGSSALAPVGALPAWVQEGSRYVHVTGHHATIDPAIQQHLSATAVAFVTTAVHRFNAQPLALTGTPASHVQQAGSIAPTLPCQYDQCPPEPPHSGGGGIAGPCPGQVVISAAGYWWGEKVYLNHCAVVNLEFIAGGGGAVATAVTAFVTGPIAILIGAYFAAYLSWITYADSYCNNGGLYLDFPWILPVVPIIERTC